MQVILLERIEKLGQMGDVVTVKPGYARNFLLPQGKARRATKENLDRFEQQRAQLEAENLEHRGEAEKIGAKLKGLVVTLIRQAGESGQLYGSVNTHDLAAEITEAGYTVARNQISLDGVIKATGLHQVKVRLHPEVSVTITANVARSDTEAEAQARSGHLLSAEEQHAAEEAAAAETEAVVARIEAEEAEQAGKDAEAEPSAEEADEGEADGDADAAKAGDDSDPEKSSHG
ncbi:MAG: 50S ribosomal protein L9 [Proteobacteria bacterium]|nr:50S ribosomal protein L9 [Pseudomonadota bacterium]